MQTNQSRLSLNGIDAIDLDSNTTSLTVSRQHNNFINTNVIYLKKNLFFYYLI